MNGEVKEPDSSRRTGRTTGALLIAIGRAIEDPGKVVEFFDHTHDFNYGHEMANAVLFRDMAAAMCAKLGLQLEMKIAFGKLLMRSPHRAPIHQEDDR